MAQQYGYGYGSYGYGYGQQPIGYGMQQMPYSQPRVGYGQTVGYPPTQAYQQTKPPQPGVPPPPPPPGTNQASTFFNAQQAGQQQAQATAQQQSQVSQQTHSTPPTPQQHAQQHQGYYGYQAYRPTVTQPYQSYYQQQQQPGTGSSQPAAVGYQPPAQPSAPSTNTISYPSYTQSSYISSANSYYKQKQQQHSSAQASQGHSHPPSPSGYTPQQQQVIQQYIHQKQHGRAHTFQRRPPFVPPQQQPVYYCEVCRVSCASAATYKTHLEGKAHKKKLQQTQSPTPASQQNGFTCELCSVTCTSRDAFEAHVKGSRHQKVVTLHRRLGKPIPEIKIPAITNSTTAKAAASIAQKEGKVVVQVAVPRITFVGGTKLSSTGTMEKSQEPIKVYPPGAAASMSVAGNSGREENVRGGGEGGSAGGGGAVGAVSQSEKAEEEEESRNDPDPVGEDLVLLVQNDPTFPHARFKCTMCDCYFNDDYAKKAHIKGRRHRLNYKKMYKPDLYVEPTKQQRKVLEKRKAFFEQKKKFKWGGPPGGVGGASGTISGGSGGGGGGTSPSKPSQPDVNELRRQEAAELAKLHAQRVGPQSHPPPGEFGYDGYYYGGEEFYGEWGWEGEPMPPPPPPPRDARDDRLVLNKHGAIYPGEEALLAVEHVVGDMEKALKVISDDLLSEQCKILPEKLDLEAGKESSRDESKRELKGVMRVGAFARGLLLKGECAVELVLMCASKPTHSLFSLISERLPAQLESLGSENVYNVTPEVVRAALTVISQVGDYPVQATITLTSTLMRDEPSPEQALADQEAGVLDRASCLAALAALRHTKWFQAKANGLPSCVIVMRVLKDICRRVPAWGVLDSWMLELLVQKCIVSANPNFTRPGDVFRRVMECVASGVFLPGGRGLLDPCEKMKMDASSTLSAQERANITLSAQHALRMIAFGKLHLVLGVDPLPPPGTSRKREAGEGEAEGESEPKKAKLDPPEGN